MKISLKEILRNKQPTIGSWLSLGSIEVAEILARSGFDWLVIDLEHSATDRNQAQQLIRVVELNDVPPLVRVAKNHPSDIKQAMDAGAHGVIVPQVNSAEDAERAVKATKYAPRGTRGTGLWRAHNYGKAFKEYCDWLEQESVVIVQIEHIQAVENIDAILAVEGVDGYMVGPYDLSASLGRPGEFEHPAVQQALDALSAAIARSPKSAGFHIVHPNPDDLESKLAAGYSFIAYGVDMIYLQEIAANHLAQARKLISQNK